MIAKIIHSLSSNFEDHAHQTEEGIEFWFARDLQHLLGYSKWENFYKVIIKAKISCEATDNEVSHHFHDVSKTIQIPKVATKEIDDFMLTRYAC